MKLRKRRFVATLFSSTSPVLAANVDASQNQPVVINATATIPVPYDSEPIACTGALGGACGDTVNLGLPSGTYSVSMVGTAKDASGLLSWIVPPCSVGISF
jgi:hypothetical protein